MTDSDGIEQRIGDVLADAGHTLATAESCTGGLIGSLLTDVPGASEYFDRTIVTYSYDAKLDLGVPREILDEYGAVSKPTAKAMAQGIRDRAKTTWGVATTGIAGPDGGTEEKPVGTVFIAIAYAGPWGTHETYTIVERTSLSGSRVEIKEGIAREALRMVEAEISTLDQ